MSADLSIVGSDRVDFQPVASLPLRMVSAITRGRAHFLICLALAALQITAPAYGQREQETPPPLQFYKGRRIAQTMHFSGANWLLRTEREEEERCSLMIANLGVTPGMTVCDMGCGNGFYALQLSKLVGESGKVLGVDIQPEMLELLKKRAEEKGVKNVVPILGTLVDPGLPKGEIDLILCVDVYHEFSHPEQMLKKMREALSPNGVIALLEYRREDPEVRIKLLHKMSRAQIMKEFPSNGFRLVREFDRLPWQHMMFFGRDDTTQND